LLDLILAKLLLTLGTPLLTAVSSRKSKSAKKTAKKKAKPVRAKKITKPVARKSVRQAAARGKKATPEKKPAVNTAAKHPVQPTPVKPDENEPMQKPVAPTGRAILLSPENDKFTDSLHPTFRWLSVGGAARYEVVWSEEPNWAQAHPVISIATEAAVPVEKPLRVGVTYYWRVRGGNEGGWGPWSSVSSFRVLDEAI
jgi:hypothetical protein